MYALLFHSQMIAKHISIQITKETNKVKKRLEQYNAFAFATNEGKTLLV